MNRNFIILFALIFFGCENQVDPTKKEPILGVNMGQDAFLNTVSDYSSKANSVQMDSISLFMKNHPNGWGSQALFIDDKINTNNDYKCGVKAQKIAFLNFDSLINTMPETKSLKLAIQKHETKRIYTTDQKQWQFPFDELHPDCFISGEERRKAVEDIVLAQQRFELLDSKIELTLQSEIATLYAPIIKKAGQVIKKIALENGYNYVLDSGSTLFCFLGGDNIFDKVKTELDKTPILNIPALKTKG